MVTFLKTIPPGKKCEIDKCESGNEHRFVGDIFQSQFLINNNFALSLHFDVV